MYLSRLTLNRSRMATLWASNPYRVHQRLKIACGDDPRLLFRIEINDRRTQILAQSHSDPDWTAAFGDFPVLAGPPDHKSVSPMLADGQMYRFRLLANPTVKRTVKDGDQVRKTRLGVLRSGDQVSWLQRKLLASGAELADCRAVPQGMMHSHKDPRKDDRQQTHYAVLYEGVLKAMDTSRLSDTIMQGVGSGKAYGFGLLSLAPLRA